MAFSLDVEIYTDNNGIRNAVSQLLPEENDPRLSKYDFGHQFEEASGFMVIACRIDFIDEVECDEMFESIHGIAGIINTCEPCSFIQNRIGHENGSNTIKERIAK